MIELNMIQETVRLILVSDQNMKKGSVKWYWEVSGEGKRRWEKKVGL